MEQLQGHNEVLTRGGFRKFKEGAKNNFPRWQHLFIPTTHEQKRYDKNARRKRCNFNLALKILALAVLVSNGSALQRFGAAQVNERSPRVVLIYI